MAEKLPSLGPKKMNWHMILIYGLLWLMAFMDLFNGMIGVFGVQMAPTGDGGMGVALHVYPGPPNIFILDGVFALIMCLFTVYVRFALAGMKRRAPMLLMILFALNALESVAYTAALYVSVPDLFAATGALNNALSTIGLTAVTAVLTYIYYARRSELFVN